LGLVTGPSAGAVSVAGRCREGYHLRKKRGVLRCVRRPDEPKPPRDAVTPSSIELIVGTLKGGYPIKVFTSGRAVTARLVIGGVSSNRLALKQS
jgi:hypothetical protein